jgi:hypothetical protein
MFHGPFSDSSIVLFLIIQKEVGRLQIVGIMRIRIGEQRADGKQQLQIRKGGPIINILIFF